MVVVHLNVVMSKSLIAPSTIHHSVDNSYDYDSVYGLPACDQYRIVKCQFDKTLYWRFNEQGRMIE